MRKSILLMIILSLLLLGCSMERFEAAEIEDIPLDGYTNVTLEDLYPFTPGVSSDEDISDWPSDSLQREQKILIDTYTTILDMSNLLMQDKTTYTYKPFAFSSQGIVSSFRFSVRDKEVTLRSTGFPPTATECTIDEVSLFFQSKGNPLKQMLGSLVFEEDFFDTALANDGTLQVSGKMRTTTKPGMFQLNKNPIVTVASILAHLRISKSTANKKTPTGLASGNLQFSMASNVVYEKKGFQKIQYYSPVVLQVAIAPFSDVCMQSLVTAMQNEYDSAEIEQRNPDYWPLIHPIVWGGSSGELVTVTRIIGSHDASAELQTDRWTNAEAFDLLFALIP